MPTTITRTTVGYTFRELLTAAADPSSGIKDSAVEKARDWFRESMDSDWHEFLLDSWKEALDQIGFTDAEIQFRGFWSQGDGASFTSGVDLDALIRFLAETPEPSTSIGTDAKGKEVWPPYLAHKLKVKATPKYARLLWVVNALSARVSRGRSGHSYYHEGTCDFDADFDYPTHGGGPDKDGRTIWVPDHPKLVALWEAFVKDAEELRMDICHTIYKELEEEYEYQIADESCVEASDANEYLFDKHGRFVR